MQSKPKPGVLIAGLLLAAILGAVSAHLMLSSGAQAPMNATVLNEPRLLPEFELIDQDGHDYTRENMAGHWSLVFFGFTNCPDICPATLNQLTRTKNLLADLDENRRPTIMLVSVDPMRDTVDKLGSYVRHFNPEFKGITGDLTEIQALAAAMGVAVSYQPLGDSYTVDHTAAVFLVDPDASMAAVFGAPHDPDILAEDYRRIIQSRVRSR